MAGKLARAMLFRADEELTFAGADSDETHFHDFSKFLFHVYKQRDSENVTSLGKNGHFGKAASSFLERIERTKALMEVAVELESREVVGVGEQRLSAPIPIETNSRIHRAAALQFPHLFRDDYSPENPNAQQISGMWRAAGMSFRKNLTWGNSSGGG